MSRGKKHLSLFSALLFALLLSCNDDSNPVGTDGSVSSGDGSSADLVVITKCGQLGAPCTTGGDCCSASCDQTQKKCTALVIGPGACKTPGEKCAAPTDCCSGTCITGICSAALCKGDNEACVASIECCGGNCANGKCTPLNTTCKTSGNACSADIDCCSKYCFNGLCNARPSFCTQLGDACSADANCCSGLCTKASGATLGVCTMPVVAGVGDCTPAGQLCSGATTGDNTFPICGGDCCSRSCRPYAPTGALICQPPSGCHPTGELCQSDADCCGVKGSPGSVKLEGGSGQSSDVHCAKAAGATIGRCDNGQACSPGGSICKLATTSCNATDRCCAGTVQTHPLNCKMDVLGIPRCTAEQDLDCTVNPPPAGTPCASSADCCNMPCVPNPAGTPPLICGAAACVPVGGACTTTADCCAGSPCTIAPGATKGICGEVIIPPTPDGGTKDGGIKTEAGTKIDGGSKSDGGPIEPTPCAFFGQVCTQTSDCCNSEPCYKGRCGIPVM